MFIQLDGGKVRFEPGRLTPEKNEEERVMSRSKKMVNV